MNDLDERLRERAGEARVAAARAFDVERDLAATLERAGSMADVHVAESPERRRPSGLVWAAAAALLVVVSIGAILVVRGDDSSRQVTVTPTAETDPVVTPPPTPDELPPTVVSTPMSSVVPPGSTTLSTAPPATQPATTEPSTVEPPTGQPTTTVVEATSNASPGGAVSYLTPPPTLPLRNIGTTQLASRGGENWIDVAVGETGVVVNQSWAGYVTVIGYDGEQHDVPIDGDIGPIVYGPGEVVYGLRSGDAIDDFAMVAVALAGDRAGTTVASSPLPIVRYTELPMGAFGHGVAGVVDRAREVNATVSEYVGVDGSPINWNGLEPALLTAADNGASISDSLGHSWRLAIDASPVAAGSYVGPSPPAPSSNGDAVSWTFIGPNARPEQDFGLQTMPVIAGLHPDGSVTWWSVPEGWEVVASDVWGTVLARLTGQKLDLALASFAGEEGQAPGPTECLGGVSRHDAAHVFTTAMLAARSAGSLDPVSKCLTEIPAGFTGRPPACWTECDGVTRTFASDSLVSGEGVNPDGTTFVTASLPVTYRTASGYLDVWETWTMTPTDDGYVISDFTIQEPPFNREQALATVAAYLNALAAHDWATAANLLYGGALEPESRGDLHQLNPEAYTIDGIAAGLARWCEFGCDTTVPTSDELDFNGSFGLTRGGYRIQVNWFEGVYSIAGLPFQAIPPPD